MAKTDSPHTAAVRFLLAHVARHGDNHASQKAQQHLDAIEEVDPEPVGDRTVYDGVMHSDSADFQSATAAFTAKDEGRSVEITHPGKPDASVKSKIAAVLSHDTVTLADKAPEGEKDKPAKVLSDVTLTIYGDGDEHEEHAAKPFHFGEPFSTKRVEPKTDLDSRVVSDGAMAINSNELHSETALFTGADLGKTAEVVHTGLNAFTLKSKIVRIASPSAVQLADRASTTIADATVTIS